MNESRNAPGDGDEWEAEPILHETSGYDFSATLDIKQNKISTKLVLKDRKTSKKKEY